MITAIVMHRNKCTTNIHHTRTTSGIQRRFLGEGSATLEYWGVRIGIIVFGAASVFAAAEALSLPSATATWVSAMGEVRKVYQIGGGLQGGVLNVVWKYTCVIT